jgi:citrate lyase beta subunit
VRDDLLLHSYDGLIREVLLDRANGMTGKSVIHPDQAAIVNALQVVTDEEYRDAQQIAATGGSGGAAASEYRNKMNESRPHTVWAHRTLRRAAAFGVTRPGRGFIDVLADGADQ